jgi:hypothetical protein
MIDFLVLLEIPTSRRMVVSPFKFRATQGENAGQRPKPKLLKTVCLCWYVRPALCVSATTPWKD